MWPRRASAMAMMATAPSPDRACDTRAPTASERVAVPMPKRPVRAQRPITVKVWNSTPGGDPVMSRAPPWDRCSPPAPRRDRALHGASLREAAETERLDVDGLGAPFHHQ